MLARNMEKLVELILEVVPERNPSGWNLAPRRALDPRLERAQEAMVEQEQGEVLVHLQIAWCGTTTIV